MKAEDYLANLSGFLKGFVQKWMEEVAAGYAYMGASRITFRLLRNENYGVYWDDDFVTAAAGDAPKGDSLGTVVRWHDRPLGAVALYREEWWLVSHPPHVVEVTRELLVPCCEVVSRPQRGAIVLPAVVAVIPYVGNLGQDAEDQMREFRDWARQRWVWVTYAEEISLRLLARDRAVSIEAKLPIELKAWPLDPETGRDARLRSPVPPVGMWRLTREEDRALVEIQPEGAEGWVAITKVGVTPQYRLDTVRLHGGVRWHLDIPHPRFGRGERAYVVVTEDGWYGATMLERGEDGVSREDAHAIAIGLVTTAPIFPSLILYWDRDGNSVWIVSLPGRSE